MNYFLAYCFLSLLLACGSQASSAPQTVYRTQDTQFRGFITQQLANQTVINPEVAFRSILEQYQVRDTTPIESKEKPIEIYVQSGIDNWDGRGEVFQLCFAHQKLDRKDGNLYEYRICLDYAAAAFTALPELDRRYEPKTSLRTFKKEIEKTAAYLKAMTMPAQRIVVSKESI